MFISCHQNEGQNYNTKMAIFENVKFD